MSYWVTGDIALEAKYDGRWVPYTPAWTAPGGTDPVISLDGILMGASARLGNTVFWSATMIAGPSTTFGAGTWQVTIPVLTNGICLASCFAYDVSADTTYEGRWIQATTTTVFGVSYNSGAGWSATFPFTWANGDSFNISGFYYVI